MAKRWISFLLILLMMASIALLTCISMFPKETGGVLSPYVYEHQYDEFKRKDQQVSLLVDHIREIQTGESVSLYPYTHFNADCNLPLVKGETGCFKIRHVQYQFQVDEGMFQVLSTQFYAAEHWRELFEEKGTLFEKRLDGFWPFLSHNAILKIPEGNNFYDPIPLSGLGGCGVLLLSDSDPGVESEIRVYIPMKRGWRQAEFCMPDGTQQDYLRGYVRRQDDHSMRDSMNTVIGKMEVCTKDQNGKYMIYQVTYSDGTLMLEENSGIDVEEEDLLNWMY